MHIYMHVLCSSWFYWPCQATLRSSWRTRIPLPPQRLDEAKRRWNSFLAKLQMVNY